MPFLIKFEFNFFFHFSDIWGLKEYCRAKQLEFQKKGIQGRRELKPSDLIIEGPRIKRQKTDGVLSQHNIVFVKTLYNGKCQIHL